MIDRELDIQTADGAMNTFVTHPEEGGPHPVVLFYMDAPGKRGELHDMARRLGTVGYFVVLPNLYYRRDRDFRMGTGDDARRIMFEHMNSLDRAKVLTDTAAMLKFVDGRTGRTQRQGRHRRLLHERAVRALGGREVSGSRGRGRFLPRRELVHRLAGVAASVRGRDQGRAVHRLRSDRLLGPAGNDPGARCASADHISPLPHRDVSRDTCTASYFPSVRACIRRLARNGTGSD